MKIKKNGKVIRLTESDLKRIVKRVIKEELTFNVNNPEFGVDGQNMERERNTYSYFNPKYNKYYTNNGIYTDHNDEEYSEEWEDYEFDDFTDLKRSDIPNDNWIDLRTRKGFDSMKGEDGKVRIRKNPYLYRRRSGFPDIRIKEQREEFEGEEFVRRLPPNIGMGHILDDTGHRVEVFLNNGFDAIEHKEDIEIITCTGGVNTLPNLSEFPNLFVVNCNHPSKKCHPLIDIDVDSLINNNIARVSFNYVDTPTMNNKVNELIKRGEEKGTMINANKVEREPRR